MLFPHLRCGGFFCKKRRKSWIWEVLKVKSFCYCISMVVNHFCRLDVLGTICIFFVPPCSSPHYTLYKCFAWEPSPVSKKSHRGGDPHSAHKWHQNLSDPPTPKCQQKKFALLAKHGCPKDIGTLQNVMRPATKVKIPSETYSRTK